MRLKEKLRQGLLGHLSEANTLVDITIASSIAREFSIAFSVFVAENYIYLENNKWLHYNNYGDKEFTTEELLKIYEDER
jgi:hypothetical protein